MRITTRIAVGLGVVSVLVIAAISHQLSIIQNLQTLNRDLSMTNLEATRVSLRVLQGVEGVREFAAKDLLLRDLDYRNQWVEWEEAVESDLERLADIGLSGEQEATRDRILDEWGSYRELAAELREGDGILPGSPGEGGVREGPPAPGVGEDRGDTVDVADREGGDPTAPPGGLPGAGAGVIHFDDVDRVLSEVRDATTHLMNLSDEETAAMASASATSARQARSVSLVTAGAVLLLGGLVFILLYLSISGPLQRLTQGTRELARGRFDHRLDTSGPHEFSALARDFNHMAARLSELDDMKKDFVSHVSHELKGPLAAIHETILVLLEEIPGPLTDKQAQLLELSRDSSDRLSTMITNLLEASRMEAGADTYEAESFDLTDVIDAVIEEHRERASDRDQRLELEVGAGVDRILADADRVRDVVTNLVDNAIKFSPADSVIELSLAGVEAPPEGIPDRWTPVVAGEIPPFVLLSVRDRGPGVPDGHKEGVFEKFHQVRRGERIRGQGVGLGLAITRRIVEAHGGATWVEDREGGGAVFRVLLPIRPSRWGDEREPGPPTEAHSPSPAGAGAPGKVSVTGAGLLLLLFVGACLPRVSEPPPPPPPPEATVVIPEEEPVEAPDPAPEESPRDVLEEARTLLSKGAYEAAAERYQKLLNRNGTDAPEAPEALWHLAFIHLLPDSPLQNAEEALELLGRLEKEHPESPQGLQAALVIELLDELAGTRATVAEQAALIQDLNETVEQLKQIDLNRRPARIPPPDTLRR